MNRIEIGNTIIGEGYPLYFIADIASNHDGDISRAFRLIELAKESGAQAAKFQNFRAEALVSRKGFDTMGGQLSHQAAWKKSVFDVYQDAVVPYNWTEQLKKKCDEVGIEYFSSPYDFKSVDEIDPFVNVYKIGSGDISWPDILEYIARKQKPVIIATGASRMTDVKRAMSTLLEQTDDIVLMQCNTNYTADKENFKHINLNVLKTYRDLYPDTILGLSDHTHGHATVLGAVALGARVFEKHFTDDNSRVGPDHKFAMNPVSWREMVERATELYYALGDGIKRIEDNEKETRIVQRRGLYYSSDLPAGHVLTYADLTALRPIRTGGIHPYEAKRITGKKLKDAVSHDTYVKWSDFE